MKHPHSMMSDLPPGRNCFFAPKYSYIISTSVILRKATGISYAMNFIQYKFYGFLLIMRNTGKWFCYYQWLFLSFVSRIWKFSSSGLKLYNGLPNYILESLEKPFRDLFVSVLVCLFVLFVLIFFLLSSLSLYWLSIIAINMFSVWQLVHLHNFSETFFWSTILRPDETKLNF